MMVCNMNAGGIILHKPSLVLKMVHSMLGNIGFSETRCNFHEPFSFSEHFDHGSNFECGQGVLSELKAFGIIPHNRSLL